MGLDAEILHKTGILKPNGIEHELCETYSVYTISFIPRNNSAL